MKPLIYLVGANVLNVLSMFAEPHQWQAFWAAGCVLTVIGIAELYDQLNKHKS